MSFDEILMAGLISNSYTELYSIMSKIIKGSVLEEFMDSIVATTAKIPFSLHSWNKKKFDQMIMDNIKREKISEGIQEGIQKIPYHLSNLCLKIIYHMKQLQK